MQDELKENHTSAHHYQTTENQILRATREKEHVISHQKQWRAKGNGISFFFNTERKKLLT